MGMTDKSKTTVQVHRRELSQMIESLETEDDENGQLNPIIIELRTRNGEKNDNTTPTLKFSEAKTALKQITTQTKNTPEKSAILANLRTHVQRNDHQPQQFKRFLGNEDNRPLQNQGPKKLNRK